MAVYKRAYRPYAGALTPAWSRFLILPRYAWGRLFKSKILTAYTVLCLVPAIVALAIIYIYNNPLVRVAIGMQAGDDLPFTIDGRFFYYVLRVQGGMVFLLTAWIGPTLVAPDLANNGLPLYLCRPFSRTEYVLGKMFVLAGVMSAVTWVPDLILYSLQGTLHGNGWFWSNLSTAWAIFAGSWVLIIVLSLLALAVSAWVKWRIAASGLLVGIFFVAAGFGEAFNNILRTYWGRILNLPYLLYIVWQDLFDLPVFTRAPRFRIGDPTLDDIPVGTAWIALFALCLGCLAILNRRLRAKEIVRG